MTDLAPLGWSLLGLGLVLVALGLGLLVAPRFGGLPFLGQLPGDLRVEVGGATLFLPLGTMLVLSVLLSVFLGLLGRR